MLAVRDLHAYYGKSHILQGVSFDVGAGEIVSLLGRNGVGRSTTIKAIMGDVPPHGSVVFKGRQLVGLPQGRLVVLLRLAPLSPGRRRHPRHSLK